MISLQSFFLLILDLMMLPFFLILLVTIFKVPSWLELRKEMQQSKTYQNSLDTKIALEYDLLSLRWKYSLKALVITITGCILFVIASLFLWRLPTFLLVQKI